MLSQSGRSRQGAQGLGPVATTEAVIVEAADTDEGSVDNRSETESTSPVGNVDFNVTQVKGNMYNKKAAKSLKLSVSGMGVLMLRD